MRVSLLVANIDTTLTLNFIWYVDDRVVVVHSRAVSDTEHHCETVDVGEEGECDVCLSASLRVIAWGSLDHHDAKSSLFRSCL